MVELRLAHRGAALLIIGFAVLHIGNHLALFGGAQAHIAVMEALRPVYRNILVEVALLGAILFQIVSGATMLWRGRKGRSHHIARLQAASGVVLLLFLAVHVSAILAGRANGVDTNIYFAVAGYYTGLSWFFVPYYFLAVSALFTHLGCALYWILGEGRAARFAAGTMVLAGVSTAAALTVLMAGWVSPIDVPASYLG